MLSRYKRVVLLYLRMCLAEQQTIIIRVHCTCIDRRCSNGTAVVYLLGVVGMICLNFTCVNFAPKKCIELYIFSDVPSYWYRLLYMKRDYTMYLKEEQQTVCMLMSNKIREFEACC